MQYSAELLDHFPQTFPRRRRHPRQALRTLAYVTLDNGNGGIIRDLTEAGIAVQAVARLRPGQVVSVRFDLLAPRVRVEAQGQVIWANSGGQAGIQFLDLKPRAAGTLRNWQLTQIFTAAAVSGRDSMFCDEPFVRDLAFSHQARPAIIVEPSPLAPVANEEHLRWKFIRIRPSALAVAIDAGLLLLAALLFAVSSVIVMGGLPDWPIATILFLSSSTIFVAVYQILFSVSPAGTPGKWLAKLVFRIHQGDDPGHRFR